MWGKTEREDGAWLPLVQHLEDSRMVAGHLWDTWLPANVRRRITDAMAGDPEMARSAVTWLAACHDVGKATPAFACQVYDIGDLDHVVDPARAAGMEVPHLARSQRRGFHHTVTGQAIVEAWLTGVHGFTRRRSAAHLAGVVGGHHGLPLTQSVCATGRTELSNPRSAVFGGEPWRAVQVEILEEMTRRAGMQRVLDHLREPGLPLTVQMDLTAIVIVADWLASDTARFPYDLSVSDDERWERGRATLDLAPPWKPFEACADTQKLMEVRFPHLLGRRANAVQRTAVRLAKEAAEAPLMIIEAPMGHGKTEAALLAAEVLAEGSGAGGVFVGLPTMATSDGMFSRVLEWLSNGAPGTAPSVYLAHSKSGLNEQYRGLASTTVRSTGVYDHEDAGVRASPVVNQWTRGRKKGVLASVVVGTIDQALFAGLQTKHLALRHLALTGKVVIIDEVHAADDYMRTYLCRVLEWLGCYGTPVILMSATLPTSQRQQLADAYLRGRGAPAVELSRSEEYPRITCVAREVATEIVEGGDDEQVVEVDFMGDEVATIAERLAAEVAEGGCAAAIVNTVGRAQDLYEEMVRRLPESDVVLAHSRFIGPHRMAKERYLRDVLGPPGPGRKRPPRLVVVGTQVLEQSHDIDVDMMVTDIAPIDLVLQRCGRLHRHDRPKADRPDRLRVPRLIVAGAGVAPTLESTPELAASAVAVYRTHPLLRAAEMLIAAASSGLSLPRDIPRLVERGYDSDRPSPAAWLEEWTRSAAEEARRRRQAESAAEAFLLPSVHHQASMVGLLPAAVPAESDDLERTGRAQVRDTDDSLEVLLAVRGSDGLVRVPAGAECAGQVVPLVLGERDRRVARALAECTVRLPRSLTHPGVIDAVIAELEGETIVAGWQSDPYLAGQLLVVLSPDGSGNISSHQIVYSAVTGLKVESSGKGPRGE